MDTQIPTVGILMQQRYILKTSVITYYISHTACTLALNPETYGQIFTVPSVPILQEQVKLLAAPDDVERLFGIEMSNSLFGLYSDGIVKRVFQAFTV